MGWSKEALYFHGYVLSFTIKQEQSRSLGSIQIHSEGEREKGGGGGGGATSAHLLKRSEREGNGGQDVVRDARQKTTYTRFMKTYTDGLQTRGNIHDPRKSTSTSCASHRG